MRIRPTDFLREHNFLGEHNASCFRDGRARYCDRPAGKRKRKLLSSKKEMIGASPARRILVEDADKDQFEFRIVIADNRLIQATFVGPAGNLLGRRFLDSLAILEPKQP